MARLPEPGKDPGQWGSILNDYLLQTHTSSGALKTGIVGNAQVSDASISEAKLDQALAAKVNAVASGGVVSVSSKTGVVTLEKADVGLENVNNTSDMGKPISTATQTALDAKVNSNDARLTDTRTPTDNTVSTLKVQDGAINTNKLANASVTDEKLAAGTANDGQFLSHDGTNMVWATVSSTTVSDATGAAKGIVQLSGDLSGTAGDPVVSRVNGVSISGTPSNGLALVATSGTAASWQSASVLNGLTERIQDDVAALLQPGTNVTLDYNDAANTLTINATGGSGSSADPYVLDLLSYGAVFDGTTNNRIAIQNAVNDATTLATAGRHVVIQVPAGVGYISSVASAGYTSPVGTNFGTNIGFGLPVNLTGSITIRGRGIEATTFKLSGSCRNLFYARQTANYDVARNLRFEDFGVDNNGSAGRCHIVFGNMPEYDTPTRYLSFDNIHAARIKVWNVPRDEAMTTYKKASFIFRGRHNGNYEGAAVSGTAPNVWQGYANATTAGWTYTRNCTFTDVLTYDAQRGILLVSDITQETAHWYEDIHYLRCRHEQSAPYSSSSPQTSFYIGGNCQGSTASIKQCVSINVGDDGIESGGMQHLTIDDFVAVNAILDGILVRTSQPMYDAATASVYINNFRNIITAEAAGTGRSVRGRGFEFIAENEAANIPIGSVTIANSIHEIDGGVYSAIGNQRAHLMGWHVSGPIQSLTMDTCQVYFRNVNYDSTTGNLIPVFFNTRTYGLGIDFGKVLIRNAKVVVENLSSNGARFELVGLVPASTGNVIVDGFEFLTINCPTAAVIRATIVQPGFMPSGFSTAITQRSLMLRKVYGKSINSTYTTTRGIRTYANDTINAISIDECDLSQFSANGDMDFGNGAGNAQRTLIGQANTYAGVPLGGRRNPQAGNYSFLHGDRLVAITSTTAARTLTLPAIANTGIGHQFVVLDESNGAGTNNITVTAAGSDTFIGGGASRSIATNGGRLAVYSNGANWVVA